MRAYFLLVNSKKRSNLQQSWNPTRCETTDAIGSFVFEVSYFLLCLNYTTKKTSMIFLPPANEVWGKVIFSEACVKNSVHRGGVPGQVPPPTRYIPLPGPVTSLGTRYTPQNQVHPLGPGTPPDHLHPEGVHAGRYGQQAGSTHPTGMHSCVMIFLTLFWQRLSFKENYRLFYITEGEKTFYSRLKIQIHFLHTLRNNIYLTDSCILSNEIPDINTLSL